MLSNERLTAIQTLRAAITPGPWLADREVLPYWNGQRPAAIVRYCTGAVWSPVCRCDPQTGVPVENAAFIAAAPQIVDDLLAERAALLARIADLEQKRLYTDWG